MGYHVSARETGGHSKIAQWRRTNHRINELLQRKADAVHAAILRETPRRTGRLASTIRTDHQFNGGKPRSTVTIGAPGLTPYLGYILDGTPPHIIMPRQNRSNPHLRFIVNGRVVFAKKVSHPGTRKNNFVQRGFNYAIRR